MNTILRVGLVASASLLMAACSTQKFEIRDGAGTAETGTSVFFIGGIGQTDTVDAAAVCGGANNVISVETQLSP